MFDPYIMSIIVGAHREHLTQEYRRAQAWSALIRSGYRRLMAVHTIVTRRSSTVSSGSRSGDPVPASTAAVREDRAVDARSEPTAAAA